MNIIYLFRTSGSTIKDSIEFTKEAKSDEEAIKIADEMLLNRRVETVTVFKEVKHLEKSA